MTRILKLVFCLCLLLAGTAAVALPTLVSAQDGDDGIEEQMLISTKYPKVEVTAGSVAEFEMTLSYIGDIAGEPREFDLVATGPQDWPIAITPAYPKDKNISSVEISPGGASEKIIVQSLPFSWPLPEPGEYPITLEVTSGDISGSYEMTVVVTARYEMVMAPTTGRYNTTTTAGKENVFTIELQNLSTAVVNDIKFSSSKPSEWAVEFTPGKVDSMAPADVQTVDVNIKPPPKVIAGDYVITIKASGDMVSADDMQVRVTVETSTVWGWVGVIIVIVVIVGLVFVFRRFSRR